MKTLTTTLLALLTCAAMPTPSHAQISPPNALNAPDPSSANHFAPDRRIEGLWDEQVTIKNCDTGATLMVSRGTNLFIRGGALVATNTAPPMAMGPTLGQWWHESHGHYFGAKMRLNRFNPNGSFAGIREIEREITLYNDANELSGTVNAQDFDPTGNLLATICASETGTRVPSP